MCDIHPFSQAEAIEKAVCKSRTAKCLSSIYPRLRGFPRDANDAFLNLLSQIFLISKRLQLVSTCKVF